MADHDQLLKDYLAAALVALQDLDETLRAYLDEGPGRWETARATWARRCLADAEAHLVGAEPTAGLSPSSYSVQRRQAVQAGLPVESVTRCPPLPLICPDCGCIWPGLAPATAPGGDPVRCSCGRLLYGQTIRRWPDDPEEERRHGCTREGE